MKHQCVAILLISVLKICGTRSSPTPGTESGNPIKCFQCALAADSNTTKEACLETAVIGTCEDSTACIHLSRKPTCYSGIKEVIFVVDGSGSIGSDNFAKVKEWLISITKDLVAKLGDAVRTQVLQYSNKDRRKDRVPIAKSDKFEIPYTLNDRLSTEEISQKIRNMTYLNSLTYTYFALLRATTVEFPQSNCYDMSKKILVVITDGNADDGASLYHWYNANKNTVTTLAVGVGNSTSLTELKTIANGDTSDDRVFHVDEFDQLTDIVEYIDGGILSNESPEDAEDYVSYFLGCGKTECDKTNSDGVERTEHNSNYTIKKTCCIDDYCNCDTTSCADAAEVHSTAEADEATDPGNTLKCFQCAHETDDIAAKEECEKGNVANITNCEDSTACIQLSRKPVCYNGILEVMFVVDGSGSIGSENFEKVREWLIDVTEHLVKLLGDSVRTQVLQYSNKDRRKDRVLVEDSKKFVIPYMLNDRLSTEEMAQKIRAMPYLNSLTYTYFALLRAMAVEFPQSNCYDMSNKVVVVITDGNADDEASLSRWYNDYKDRVTAFAIGVGDSISEEELRTIANGGTSDERVFQVGDFDHLSDLTKSTTDEIAKMGSVKDTGDHVSFFLGCGESKCDETNSDGGERVEYNSNYIIHKTCCTGDNCNCNTTACADAAQAYRAALESDETTG